MDWNINCTLCNELIDSREKHSCMQGRYIPPEVLQFFRFEHLPDRLKRASHPFCQLAVALIANLPENREREKALDRLLEAKDAAVRSLLLKAPKL